MFQGTGTRGKTSGWSIGDNGLGGSLGGSGSNSGRTDGFSGSGHLAMGLDGIVTRRGSDEGAKNGGGS